MDNYVNSSVGVLNHTHNKRPNFEKFQKERGDSYKIEQIRNLFNIIMHDFCRNSKRPMDQINYIIIIDANW